MLALVFTRSAIFTGRIRRGQEEAFYAAVNEHLVPAWSQILHAITVRAYWPVEAEPDGAEVFLVQEIDSPDGAKRRKNSSFAGSPVSC